MGEVGTLQTHSGPTEFPVHDNLVPNDDRTLPTTKAVQDAIDDLSDSIAAQSSPDLTPNDDLTWPTTKAVQDALDALATLEATEKLSIPDGTPVNAVASTLTTALLGADNDLKYTAATKGVSGDEITVEYAHPGTPSAALSVEVNSGTDITVNLATSAGVAASAAIGAGANGVVTSTSETVGNAGNDLSIEVVTGAEVGGALAAALVGNAITVTLGMDSGTKSSADIGAGVNGTVTTEVDLPGVAGDAHSIEVAAGTVPGGAMAAAILAQAIDVTLGMTSGQRATAQLGGGSNGRVDLIVTAPGIAGNNWTVLADGTGANDCDLAVGQVGEVLTIQLGKVAADLAPAKNTAALIVAALTALGSTDFSATASGDGSGSLLAGEGPVGFEGGANIAIDATKNTAALIAAAISLLDGVTATASGDGSTAIPAAEGPTAFTGGADIAVDNAKNTATLVAAAVGGLNGIAAAASGTGVDPLTAAEGPTPFATGANPAITSTAAQVSAAIAADGEANALVGVENAANNNGTGVVTIMEAAFLENGVDGTVGAVNELKADASFLYHCIAANTVAGANWRRVSLGTVY